MTQVASPGSAPGLVARVESFRGALVEIKMLNRLHYEDLALDKDRVPLNPNYDAYLRLEDNGELVFVALRQGATLVGYFIGFATMCLHYQILTCSMDIFWVHPDHRGRFGGIRLFRCVEQELRRRGVVRWFVGEKLHKPSGRLFAALGFRPIETHWSKMLGG